MSKIVKELVTKWTYRVDATQLTKATRQVADLKKKLLDVRRASVAFGRQERGQIKSMGSGWDRATRAVEKYSRAKERAGRAASGFSIFGGGGGRGGGGRGNFFGGGASGRIATLASTLGGGALGGLAVAGGGVVAGGGALGLAGAVGLAGRKEQARASIGGLLGDFDKADALIENLNEFAKKTPFQIGQLRELGSVLLAGGFEANEIVDSLRMLGDVTRGNNEKLNRMLFNFVQVRTVGRASSLDMRQFAMAGIPIYIQLQKQLGKTREEIDKMTRDGKLSFEIIKEAFRQMTGESGRFFRGMELQSQTLFGIFSNIKDSISVVGEGIGDELLPKIKEVSKGFKEWLEVNKKDIIDNTVVGMQNLGSGFKGIFDFIGKILESVPLLKVALGGLAIFLTWKFKPISLILGGILALIEDIGAYLEERESTIGNFISLFDQGVWQGVKDIVKGGIITSGEETLRDMNEHEERKRMRKRAANRIFNFNPMNNLSSIPYRDGLGLVSPPPANLTSRWDSLNSTVNQTNNFNGGTNEEILDDLSNVADGIGRNVYRDFKARAAN